MFYLVFIDLFDQLLDSFETDDLRINYGNKRHNKRAIKFCVLRAPSKNTLKNRGLRFSIITRFLFRDYIDNIDDELDREILMSILREKDKAQLRQLNVRSMNTSDTMNTRIQENERYEILFLIIILKILLINVR